VPNNARSGLAVLFVILLYFVIAVSMTQMTYWLLGDVFSTLHGRKDITMQ